MLCTTCKRASLKRGLGAKPSRNFRKSVLLDHEDSKEHLQVGPFRAGSSTISTCRQQLLTRDSHTCSLQAIKRCKEMDLEADEIELQQRHKDIRAALQAGSKSGDNQKLHQLASLLHCVFNNQSVLR